MARFPTIAKGIIFKGDSFNPVAQAPVNTSPPVISPEGNQVIGTVFTSGNGSWFATRPLTFEYRWTRNGTPISGATSQTYTSVSADEGQTLRCEVRATNAFGVSSYIASSNSSTGVSLPVNTVAPVISGSTTLGSVLTTTDGTWTGTSPITFSYQWKRGGVSIGGATSSTYTLVAADSSANITCEVTGTNVAGSVAANSNTITAQNFNPVNTIAPTLSPSGTQSTGTVITLGNGTWSGATPITFEYRWTRDNIVISGQTSNTYTLVAGDAGTVIKGQVRATNALSTSAYVTSSNQVDAINVIPLLLDSISDSAFAYSFFKLKNSATNCIRVRRDSDNAEQNIGFASNYIDTASMLSFVGSNNGRIVKFYDQSGNGYDAELTTASQQLQIVTSGSLNLVGSILVGQKMSNNGGYTVSTYTKPANAVLEDFAITKGNEHQQIGYNGDWNWVTRPDATRLVMNSNGGAISYVFSGISSDTTNMHISNLVLNNTTASMYYDKTQVGSSQTIIAPLAAATTRIWEWDASRFGSLFIRFGKNLSAGERTTINTFFTDKFGI